MVKEEKKEQKHTTILVLVVGFVLILAALALGVKSGWLGSEKIVLGEEYIGDFVDYKDISTEEYGELVEKKDSFILFVDQNGCETADTVREFVKDWATEKKVKVLRIMFSKMKETSLHEYVKYYPSVVVISEGRPIGYLRADNNEDAEMYNNYEVFKGWIEKYF
ncbi:hypothetical protein IJH24_01565 [Candidatus Saccharibacteria bacterium]|nr:hypothetical protein [Candidatus Saccharibacteria bacterium]